MAEGVNVRFSGPLKGFVDQQTGENGLYGSASEYIRHLVRRDYEREEKRRWGALYAELKPGMDADESEFVELDIPALIAAAKKSVGLEP